jgi:hypothetical protein
MGHQPGGIIQTQTSAERLLMNVAGMTSRYRAVLTASLAGLLLLTGCGGGKPPEPDPVAYQIAGVDLVPDLIAGRADIGVTPQDPTNLRDPVVILEIPLNHSCSVTGTEQYKIATSADVGVGTKHYRMSGNPANVSIDEATGVVTTTTTNCVTGAYVLVYQVDAISNGKMAQSNTMKVRLNIHE